LGVVFLVIFSFAFAISGMTREAAKGWWSGLDWGYGPVYLGRSWGNPGFSLGKEKGLVLAYYYI